MKIYCKITLSDGTHTVETIKAKSSDEALGVIEMRHRNFSTCEFYDISTDEQKFLGKVKASTKTDQHERDPVLAELQKANEHLEGIKWACRSAAIGLALIVIFGFKITFE